VVGVGAYFSICSLEVVEQEFFQQALHPVLIIDFEKALFYYLLMGEAECAFAFLLGLDGS